MSLDDAGKEAAKGGHRNGAGKLAESAQLAHEDEELQDMICIHLAAAIFNNQNSQAGIDDQTSFEVVTKSPLTEKWSMTMNQKLDTICRHQLFGALVKLPEGRKALPGYWAYKIKPNEACNVQRFKARLGCGGNHKIEGINYQASYATTAYLGHARLALTITTKYNLQIHHMDIRMAFLDVDLEEEIYMYPPQGYICLLQNGSWYNDPRFTNTSPKMILHLTNALYGLKQSSDGWYGTCKDFRSRLGLWHYMLTKNCSCSMTRKMTV